MSSLHSGLGQPASTARAALQLPHTRMCSTPPSMNTVNHRQHRRQQSSASQLPDPSITSCTALAQCSNHSARYPPNFSAAAMPPGGGTGALWSDTPLSSSRCHPNRSYSISITRGSAAYSSRCARRHAVVRPPPLLKASSWRPPPHARRNRPRPPRSHMPPMSQLRADASIRKWVSHSSYMHACSRSGLPEHLPKYRQRTGTLTRHRSSRHLLWQNLLHCFCKAGGLRLQERCVPGDAT